MGGIQVHIVLAPHLEKNWLLTSFYTEQSFVYLYCMKIIHTSLIALFLLSCASASWLPQHSHEDSVFSQKVSTYSELRTEQDSFKGEAINIQTGERFLMGNFPSEIGGYKNFPYFQRALLEGCEKWTGGSCVISRFMNEVYFANHKDIQTADRSSSTFKRHTLWAHQTPEEQSGLSKLVGNVGEVFDTALDVAVEVAPTAFCARTKGNYRNAKYRKAQAERDERTWRSRANISIRGSGAERQNAINKRNNALRQVTNAQNRARNAQNDMDRYKRDYRNWGSNSLNKNSESCFELSGLLD